MRLHLSTAVRRGLVLAVVILTITSFSLSRRSPRLNAFARPFVKASSAAPRSEFSTAAVPTASAAAAVESPEQAKARLTTSTRHASSTLSSAAKTAESAGTRIDSSAMLTSQTATRTSAVVITTPPSAAALAFTGLGGTIAKSDGTILSTPIPSTPGKRTIHFILPATTVNKLVCKTLFSASINDYPPPVLLNFNAVFRSAEEARFMKIAAIHKYMSMQVHDDDLVIVMDSYDTWFQMPFETLISRYYKMQERDRQAHYKKYAKNLREGKHKTYHPAGIIVSSSEAASGDRIDPLVTAADEIAASGKSQVQEDSFPEEEGVDIPPYAEHVIFGADKICWPNPRNSPACKNVPFSTLPDKIYGERTDSDSYSFMNRPRWLNSGNIIGPAKVLKEIYMRAFDVQQRAKQHFSDQLILADIFGKQDLPIRIDYESYLFQTMTHSHADILFLYEDQVEDGESSDPVVDPITGVSSDTGARGNHNANERIADFENKQLVDDAFFVNTTRRKSDKYLAWNRVSGHVPVVLHFNGPKLPLETWWSKMWWVHDQSPVHRLQRLKYVRRHGGAFVDDDGKVFKPFKELCGKFDMFEYTTSPFDRAKIHPGQSPSLDPEPFRLGMNPRRSPSDVLRSLARLKQAAKDKAEARQKAEKDKAAKANKAAKGGQKDKAMPKDKAKDKPK